MTEVEMKALVDKVGLEAAKEIALKMEEAAKLLDAKIELSVKTATKEAATKEEIEKVSLELKTVNDSLLTILKTQGTEMAELKKASFGNLSAKSKLIKVIEENKIGIEGSTKKGKDFEFVIKADTLRASVVGNQAALDLTDIGQIGHRKLTVYDIFRKVPVPQGSNGIVRYVDWDAATIVRAAAAVAEGSAFPESKAQWATFTLALEKVGDIIPAAEELMYDAPLFAAELTNFLETNVAIKIDTDLISGTGVSPQIKGLKAQIPNYVPVASGITDASIYDLLVKVRESITASFGSKYSPNVALMNITDINKMKLKKDATNNYVMPPFFNQQGQVVDGITIIECNSFAANTMAVGDSRYGAIYEIPGIVVETGIGTGDFESDMMSIKARKRLNLLIRNADSTGWSEVTSISAALVTLATV